MLAAEVMTVSAPELDQLTVIKRIIEKRLSHVKAAKQWGVTKLQSNIELLLAASIMYKSRKKL